ncbi:hypothetical protein BDW59DRAFT_164749 [Aspergillus cavernicola]|uniref:Uncharacterized protein n=1 Tax=Aspergillus cavernicola TaxID=176166 RepID=A0ABR4HXA3_9EURO
MAARVFGFWTYNGARHSFKRLWLFLRTILGNPHLACLVRTVHIGNWGVNPYTLLEQEFDHPIEKMDLLRRAIGQAKLTHIKSDMIHDIHQGDRRPLMALLLASLPSLIRIHAHVPLADPYLATVLQNALNRQECGDLGLGSFNQLRELCVFAEVPVIAALPTGGYLESPEAPLRLDNLWPVLFLKSLQTVSLYDLDMDGIAVLLKQKQNHRTSYINSLSLTTLRMSRCKSADIKAMLALPDLLSSFSLFINDQMSGRRKAPSKVSNMEISDALQKHQRTLQYLDILRVGQHGNPDSPLGHLKSLQPFTQLRDLRVQISLLTGLGFPDTPEHSAPCLKHILPESLEAFRLYGKHGLHSLHSLAMQIKEVMMGNLYPLLKSITLEDNTLTQAVLDNSLLQPGIKIQFQRACGGQIIEPDCRNSEAGNCLGSWGDMYAMRIDGNRQFFNLMQRIFPGDSDEESGTGPSLPYPQAIHILPFADHTGDTTRPGYMAFKNYTEIPLPPLFPVIVYFTHINTVPSAVDLKDLYTALTTTEYDFNPRFDIYFIPGASEMDCRSHYRSEKIARGSCSNQIRAFKDHSGRPELELLPPPPPPGMLPGMLTGYPECYNQDVLFICTERNWQDGQQSLLCVQFDSRTLQGDKEEGREETITREVWPFNRRSPAFDEESDTFTVADKMADSFHWAEDELDHVWEKASNQGWMNW